MLVAGELGPDSLGNFRADFTTEDHAIVGLVVDAGAVLDVTGTISLTDDRAYSLIGFVAPNNETPPAINQNLRFLGPSLELGTIGPAIPPAADGRDA